MFILMWTTQFVSSPYFCAEPGSPSGTGWLHGKGGLGFSGLATSTARERGPSRAPASFNGLLLYGAALCLYIYIYMYNIYIYIYKLLILKE